MSNLVRKATLLTAGALLLAVVANAGVPNGSTSTKPAGVLAVGYYNPPDARGSFTYTIKDGAGVSVGAGINVVIDFTNCTDFTICATQTTGGSVVGNVLTATTNGLGQVTCDVVGKGNGAGPARATTLCATVTAGGQPFPNISVATLDRSGVNGAADGADLANWVLDFVAFQVSAIYRGRSDFTFNNAVGGEDLALWVAAFVEANTAGTGSANSCP